MIYTLFVDGKYILAIMHDVHIQTGLFAGLHFAHDRAKNVFRICVNPSGSDTLLRGGLLHIER